MPNFFSIRLEQKANRLETNMVQGKLLRIKISLTTLKNEIERHSNYLMRLSISDVFNACSTQVIE